MKGLNYYKIYKKYSQTSYYELPNHSRVKKLIFLPFHKMLASTTINFFVASFYLIIQSLLMIIIFLDSIHVIQYIDPDSFFYGFLQKLEIINLSLETTNSFVVVLIIEIVVLAVWILLFGIMSLSQHSAQDFISGIMYYYSLCFQFFIFLFISALTGKMIMYLYKDRFSLHGTSVFFIVPQIIIEGVALLILLLISLLLNEYSPISINALRKSTTNYIIFLNYVLILTCLVSGMIPEENVILIFITHLIGALLSSIISIKFFRYYDLKINQISICSNLAYFCTTLLILIFYLCSYLTNFQICIFFWIAFIVLLYLCVERSQKYYFNSLILSKSYMGLSDESELNDYCNYYYFLLNSNHSKVIYNGLISMHRIECPNPLCPSKSKNPNFMPSLQRFSNTNKIAKRDPINTILLLATFYGFYRANKLSTNGILINFASLLLDKIGKIHLTHIVLCELENNFLSFAETFYLFHLRSKLEKATRNLVNDLKNLNSFNPYIALAFDYLQSKLRNQIIEAATMQTQYWDTLSSDILDLREMTNDGIKWFTAIQKTKKTWTNLNDIYPRSIPNLILYSKFAIYILHDEFLGNYLVNKSLEYSTSRFKMINNYLDYLLGEEICFLIISKGIDEVWRIAKANIFSKNCLGHRDIDLIGTDIRILMPDMIKKQHTNFIDTYINTGYSKVMDKSHKIYAVNLQSQIIVLKAIFKCLPSFNEGLKFIGFFQKDIQNKGVILADENGKIECFSPEIAHNLHLENINPNLNPLFIQQICPLLGNLKFDGKIIKTVYENSSGITKLVFEIPSNLDQWCNEISPKWKKTDKNSFNSPNVSKTTQVLVSLFSEVIIDDYLLFNLNNNWILNSNACKERSIFEACFNISNIVYGGINMKLFEFVKFRKNIIRNVEEQKESNHNENNYFQNIIRIKEIMKDGLTNNVSFSDDQKNKKHIIKFSVPEDKNISEIPLEKSKKFSPISKNANSSKVVSKIENLNSPLKPSLKFSFDLAKSGNNNEFESGSDNNVGEFSSMGFISEYQKTNNKHEIVLHQKEILNCQKKIQDSSSNLNSSSFILIIRIYALIASILIVVGSIILIVSKINTNNQMISFNDLINNIDNLKLSFVKIGIYTRLLTMVKNSDTNNNLIDSSQWIKNKYIYIDMNSLMESNDFTNFLLINLILESEKMINLSNNFSLISKDYQVNVTAVYQKASGKNYEFNDYMQKINFQIFSKIYEVSQYSSFNPSDNNIFFIIQNSLNSILYSQNNLSSRIRNNCISSESYFRQRNLIILIAIVIVISISISISIPILFYSNSQIIKDLNVMVNIPISKLIFISKISNDYLSSLINNEDRIVENEEYFQNSNILSKPEKEDEFNMKSVGKTNEEKKEMEMEKSESNEEEQMKTNNKKKSSRKFLPYKFNFLKYIIGIIIVIISVSSYFIIEYFYNESKITKYFHNQKVYDGLSYKLFFTFLEYEIFLEETLSSGQLTIEFQSPIDRLNSLWNSSVEVDPLNLYFSNISYFNIKFIKDYISVMKLSACNFFENPSNFQICSQYISTILDKGLNSALVFYSHTIKGYIKDIIDSNIFIGKQILSYKISSDLFHLNNYYFDKIFSQLIKEANENFNDERNYLVSETIFSEVIIIIIILLFFILWMMLTHTINQIIFNSVLQVTFIPTEIVMGISKIKKFILKL